MDTGVLKDLGYEGVPNHKGISRYTKQADVFGFTLYPYGGGLRLSLSFSFKDYKNSLGMEREFIVVDSDTPIDSKEGLEKEECVLVEKVLEEGKSLLAFVERKVKEYEG